MTEQEWWTLPDAAALLDSLGVQARPRQLRLFCCACCRRIWHLLPDLRSRNAVEIAERFADGLANREKLEAAFRLAEQVPRARGETVELAALIASEYQEDSEEFDYLDLQNALGVTYILRNALANIAGRRRSKANKRAYSEEAKAHADTVRCIFGNPFRPVVFDGRWRMPQVLALARAMYEDRRFDDMPLLADALEEAGCTEEAILKHCREPGEHVRGCWVVDLILGKE